MRTRSLTTTVGLLAAAALAAAAGTASPTPAEPASPGERTAAAGPTARTPRVPVLVDCLRHPEVRPSTFMLACGDGNSRLESLRWTRWNGSSARAEGVNWVNDCTPYCAAGRFHAYRVTVTLDKPVKWDKRPGTTHFSRMLLEYEGEHPDHARPRTVVPLWD